MKHSDSYNFNDSKLIVDSLQQRVYRRIKTLILINKLRPGQTLNIDKLAREFGVSQTPVREALAMLKSDGLVIKGYHRTPTVAEIEEGDVREIYEVRIMIEGFAIKKVINKLNNEDLNKFRYM
jgi:DNA-binding GntR family transcriptional regulator